MGHLHQPTIHRAVDGVSGGLGATGSRVVCMCMCEMCLFVWALGRLSALCFVFQWVACWPRGVSFLLFLCRFFCVCVFFFVNCLLSSPRSLRSPCPSVFSSLLASRTACTVLRVSPPPLLPNGRLLCARGRETITWRNSGRAGRRGGREGGKGGRRHRTKAGTTQGVHAAAQRRCRPERRGGPDQTRRGSRAQTGGRRRFGGVAPRAPPGRRRDLGPSAHHQLLPSGREEKAPAGLGRGRPDGRTHPYTTARCATPSDACPRLGPSQAAA